MTTKELQIYALVFFGFLLLALPLGGISVFQVGRWWWVYNIVLMLFGIILMQVAIDMRSYRWAVMGAFIVVAAIILFFLVGPYFAQQLGLNTGQISRGLDRG